MMKRQLSRTDVKALLILLQVLLLMPQAGAQHFRNAFEALKAKYANVETLHVVMSIRAFQDSTSKTPYFTERADIKRLRTSYRYVMNTSDVLMNDKYIIMTDKGAREMVVSARDPKTEAALNNPAMFNIDSIFHIIGEPVLVGEANAVQHFRLKQEAGTIRHTDLFLDTARGHMEKIVYHYRDGQVAIVVFEIFDTTATFTAGTFDESYFVVVAKGRMKTSARFQGYTLIGPNAE